MNLHSHFIVWCFNQALDEEKLVYERSNSKNIYLNVAVNTLKKLRSKSATAPAPTASMSDLYKHGHT